MAISPGNVWSLVISKCRVVKNNKKYVTYLCWPLRRSWLVWPRPLRRALCCCSCWQLTAVTDGAAVADRRPVLTIGPVAHTFQPAEKNKIMVEFLDSQSRHTTLRFKVSSCNSSWNKILIRSVLPQTIGHAMNDFTNGPKLFLNGWWLIRTPVYCQLFLPSTEVEHSLNLQVFEFKSSLNVSCVRDAVKYEKAPLKGWGGECYRPKIDHTCAEVAKKQAPLNIAKLMLELIIKIHTACLN